MKSNPILTLLIGLFIINACQKKYETTPVETDIEILQSNPEIVKKAKRWVNENIAYIEKSGERQDLEIKDVGFMWDKYTLDSNGSGQVVLTLPLEIKGIESEKSERYLELGAIVDPYGNINGMIKEYLGNPFVGEMPLNLYTGLGKKFESGWYRADTKELYVRDKKNFLGAPDRFEKIASNGGGTINGGTIEEVVIVGNPGGNGNNYPPPTWPTNPNPNPNPPGSPNTGIPVSPGNGNKEGDGRITSSYYYTEEEANNLIYALIDPITGDD